MTTSDRSSDNVVAPSLRIRQSEQRSRSSDMEPMTGIEPAYSAWEADVLPLNYIGLSGEPVITKANT